MASSLPPVSLLYTHRHSRTSHTTTATTLYDITSCPSRIYTRTCIGSHRSGGTIFPAFVETLLPRKPKSSVLPGNIQPKAVYTYRSPTRAASEPIKVFPALHPRYQRASAASFPSVQTFLSWPVSANRQGSPFRTSLASQRAVPSTIKIKSCPKPSLRVSASTLSSSSTPRCRQPGESTSTTRQLLGFVAERQTEQLA